VHFGFYLLSNRTDQNNFAMERKIFLSIILTILTLISDAQTTIVNKDKVQSFLAGGVSIRIPVPDTTFIEVGNDNRKSMDIFVPQSNRLLSAYVLTGDLPHLFKEEKSYLMARYALVEVPREGENMDCEVSDFKQVTDGLKESIGNTFSTLSKESEDEFNSRMKSLDLADMQVKIGQPVQLGCFFSKNDVIGFGMLMGYEIGGSNIKMGMAVILMRVNKRLLFVYLYAEYKNDETIKWLRNTGEKWSDEILKANHL
jgi:hypothetical protein